MSARTRVAGLVAIMASAVVAAACGSSGGGGGPSSSGGAGGAPTLQQNIANEVPQAMKTKGTLSVASDATYAPNEFVDPSSGQIMGWDIDLAKEISTVIGLPFNIQNITFANIIPNMGQGASSKYDLAVSSFTPTTDREANVDFVSYYTAGESWIVKTDGPSISKATDLCGLTVAVENTTTEQTDAFKLLGKNPDGTALSGGSNVCAAAGKPDVTIHSFDKQTEADTDVLGGHSQVNWADTPVAYYQVKLNSMFKVTGQPCGVAPYGVAVAKGNGLTQAITDAVKYLIDNGFYKKILDNWNVASGAIPSSQVTLNNNNAIGAACV
jgi:polar amino acid transport system substrate-binding protein